MADPTAFPEANRILTQAECNALPVGARVAVRWWPGQAEATLYDVIAVEYGNAWLAPADRPFPDGYVPLDHRSPLVYVGVFTEARLASTESPQDG